MADSGRTVFGGVAGEGLRIPPSDEVGAPLGRNTTTALTGAQQYTVVWNRNDDTGVAFPAATPVAFPEQTCTLNADHDSLAPDDGIYRFGWTLNFTAGVADAKFSIVSPGAGVAPRGTQYALPAGQSIGVSDSGIFLSSLDSLSVTVYNAAGNLTVGSGVFYFWKLR